jgi:hypothetical protein
MSNTFGDSNAEKPFSTDMIQFLRLCDAQISYMMHPVGIAQFRKQFEGKVVEWSGKPGCVIDYEAESEETTRYAFSVRVAPEETPVPPLKSKAVFDAYFNDKSSYHKVVNAKITVRGKLHWSEIKKEWDLYDCVIL